MADISYKAQVGCKKLNSYLDKEATEEEEEED